MAATHTTNLNLNKPDREDFVRVVNDINDNMDILDAAYGSMATFRKIVVGIGVDYWYSSGGQWVTNILSAYISASSYEFFIPDKNYGSYCKAAIILEKTSGNDGVKFTTATKPTGTIGGIIYVFDNDDHKIPVLLQSTVVPIANGGTGQSTLAGAKSALGITAISDQIANKTYLMKSGTDAYGVLARSGNVVFFSVYNSFWNSVANTSIISNDTNAVQLAIPAGYKPAFNTEIKEALNNKRITITTNGAVFSNEAFSSTALRFSSCWITNNAQPT